MRLARVFTAASACVVFGAAVAACSGSFGSGTGLPQTMGTPSFGNAATPTAAPKEVSSILTYGESTAFQQLPEVGGYGGSIAFPKAAPPTAAPASKGKNGASPQPQPAPTPVAIAIGATLSVVKPQDGPDLNFEKGKGRHRKTRERPARALAYITLLPTHDATLESYPRIQLDIPREIATQYRDGEFGLALWNSGEKDAKYRLAVAEIDTASTPPPMRAPQPPLSAASAKPASSGAPSPAASATAATRVFGSPAPGTSAVPGASAVPAPLASPTLPPERILFAPTAATLKLVANRPAIFALYALPHPSAATAPKAAVGSPAPKANGSPAVSSPESPHPAESVSPSPAASPKR